MRRCAVLIIAFSSFQASAQQAPFCVVSQGGQPQCSYHYLPACQSAAQALQGMCVANPAAFRQSQSTIPEMQHPDFYGSFQRGYENGVRQRQQREEHAAKMRLYEAQAESLRAKLKQPPVSTAVYRCTDATNTPYYTPHPATGCVVVVAP